MIHQQWIAAGFCIALAAGCGQPRPHDAADALALQRQEWYARATTVIPEGTLWKPAEAQRDSEHFPLAPLIVWQVADPADAQARLGAGRSAGFIPVEIDRSGRPARAEEGPTIYVAKSTARLHGSSYEQYVYLWWQAGDERVDHGSASPPLHWQGIRITLDVRGMPVIWELLAESADIAVVFVAASLEQSAQERFGGPLPGRRFAVECGLRDQPRVVISQVLDDGPAAMGPMVYVEADPVRVATMACRCMPSQVDAIRDDAYYSLMPLDTLAGWTIAELPVTGSNAAQPSVRDMWQRVLTDPAWLDEALRVPPGF